MHAHRPLPLLPALPAATLRAYAGAHFGKSLLWYTGELLLIFALTEHAGLDAIAAGCDCIQAGMLSEREDQQELAGVPEQALAEVRTGIGAQCCRR